MTTSPNDTMTLPGYTPIDDTSGWLDSPAGPQYIKDGYFLGAQLSPEQWAKVNPTRCMICHPSPVPPFFDCPHGHSLTPWRIEHQIRWYRIAYFWYYGLLTTWLGWWGLFPFAILWLGAWGFLEPIVAGVISTVAISRAWKAWVYKKRLLQQQLLCGGIYSESPNWTWEPNTKRNTPWIKRIF